MSVRLVATAAALVGGIAWVANYFLDLDVLVWAGGVLLAVAVAAVGASMVKHPGIKVIAVVGALLLAGSVYSLILESADGDVVHLVAGGLATLLVAVAYARRPHSGNH